MYVKEHYPYFIIIAILNICVLFIGFIDSSIPFESLIYIVLINLVILTLGVYLDYRRKRNFYKDIRNLSRHEHIEHFERGRTNFQDEYLQALDRLKRQYYKSVEKESSRTKENLDEMTRFIHDLKMPLTTMQLMLNDLEQKDKEKLSIEWQRIDQKLNEILYLKRLPNIKNDLHFETIDFKSIIDHSVQKLRTICLHKGIGFDIHLNVAEVVNDMKWVSFIIDQLISNAVKYSDSNDIEIRTTMIDGFVHFSIKDYGRGIKEADMSRLFDAGFTSTSDKTDSQSTGMGLYLAKEASDALEIDISLESEYGVYTIVVLKFPKVNDMTKIQSM